MRNSNSTAPAGRTEGAHPGGQVQPGELAVEVGRPRCPRVGAPRRRHPGDIDVVLDEGGHFAEKSAPAGTDGPATSAWAPVECLIRQAVQRGVDRFGARDFLV